MRTNIVSSRENNSSTNAKERQANKSLAGKRGDVKPGGRMVGAATKDTRHGLHTDHTARRRSESRRQGYMGKESQDKSNRKNI